MIDKVAMNPCDCAIDNRVALNDAFELLHQQLKRLELPRKTHDRYGAWFEHESLSTLAAISDNLRVYRTFPSNPPYLQQTDMVDRWYWFVGPQGLVHEFNQPQN